jgi:hypothetical protein
MKTILRIRATWGGMALSLLLSVALVVALGLVCRAYVELFRFGWRLWP